MKFVAIDFETANRKWSSICAVGMVMVDGGKIVDEYYSLVNPEDSFDSFNINIHGITPAAVAKMPNFRVISQQLWPWLSGNLVVAHNASFDMNALRKAAKNSGLTVPSFSYMCTCQIAKVTWPHLINHRLSTVSQYLSLKLLHHNAMSDSRACAGIFLKAMETYGCEDAAVFSDKQGVKVHQI